MERFEVVEIPAQRVAMVRRIVPMAEITEFFGEAFGTVMSAVAAAGDAIIGEPFGWYHGMPTDTVDVAAGFPVAGAGRAPGGPVVVEVRPGGRAVVCIHVGPYDTMVDTYRDLQAWMAGEDLVARDDMWEEYLSEPVGDPATWRTRIVMPLSSPG